MKTTLGLPKDFALGESIITICKNNEIFIENYKGIIESNEHFIYLTTKDFRILIEGKMLIVNYYNNDEMKITGKITQISLLE